MAPEFLRRNDPGEKPRGFTIFPRPFFEANLVTPIIYLGKIPEWIALSIGVIIILAPACCLLYCFPLDGIVISLTYVLTLLTCIFSAKIYWDDEKEAV